ncbi:MAG: oleate hydratase [Gemmatimonadota bacterium]
MGARGQRVRGRCGSKGCGQRRSVHTCSSSMRRMPYLTRLFLPRRRSDRPLPGPRDPKHFSCISPVVDMAREVMGTGAYSLRAAQMAVFAWLRIERKIPPLTPHDTSRQTQGDALIKAFTDS